MNAHGEILIEPCPEIAGAGNRLDFRIPGNDRFELDLAQLDLFQQSCFVGLLNWHIKFIPCPLYISCAVTQAYLNKFQL